MDQNQKKILIVEDDIQTSRVYESQLAKEGFLTILARDGEEALKLLIYGRPDLVILDLMIPKKNGFEVLGEIRKNPEFLKIPILIISNLGQSGDKDRAMGLGATEYLVKVDHPIKEIISKIKAYLSIVP